MQTLFFVEMTDTFGGEANYCWVNRFLVKAKSKLGAIRKVTTETGYYARKDYDAGDIARYNSKDACICYFIQASDGEESAQYSNIKVL